MAGLSLKVDRVTVAYNNGNVALRDASFELSARDGNGTVCALVGMNGSGKSTLFKAIMGFVRPTLGTVTISGEPVKAAHKRSAVAYVPQVDDVDWGFPVSVWDVVLMGRYGYMNFLRMASGEDKKIAMESLERVGMAEFTKRQIGELSGGQKKRVFLARALAQQGEVVLLDEPFTGVDVKTEGAIIELLGQMRREGKIILVSTHDLGAVPTFCDRAVIINRTVLAAGKTSEVFTAENLAKAFGGALRQFELGGKQVLTDDEGALVLPGKDGELGVGSSELNQGRVVARPRVVLGDSDEGGRHV